MAKHTKVVSGHKMHKGKKGGRKRGHKKGRRK